MKKLVKVILILLIIILVLFGITCLVLMSTRRFGDIPVTMSVIEDGDFYEINDDNMLGLQGYYMDKNYITFVFSSTSKLNADDFERIVNRTEDNTMFMGLNFSGIIYKQDLFHKYATFYYGGNGCWNYIKRGYFVFPTSDIEFETGYYVDVNGISIRGNIDCDAYISFHQQTDAIDNGNYINYEYDETTEYYDASDDSWTTEFTEGVIVNNMPLE